MKVLGIVMEANPFHNGHKYFIDECKKQLNPEVIIAITSTSFSMRGEISLLNKFDKAKILMNHGVDIVLELPMIQSLHSADNFAMNSILNLSNLGITDLAFGSETEDITLLNKFCDILLSNDFKKDFSNIKNFNTSTKNTYSEILKNYLTESEIDLFNKPNITLAVQYLKTIRENNLNITPHIIKRIVSNYHDTNISNNIASATAIRKAIANHKEFEHTLPLDSLNSLINYEEASKKYFDLIKYKYLLTNIDDIFLNDEGINNYIINNGVLTTLDGFQESLKNKRYSINRINRQLLYTLLNIKEVPEYIPYLRILAISKTGLLHINKLGKNIKKQIFSGTKEIKKQNEIVQYINKVEIKATILYGIITNNNQLVLEEAKLPILNVERK